MSTQSGFPMTPGNNGHQGQMPQPAQPGIVVHNPLVTPGNADIQLGKVLIDGKEKLLVILCTESCAVTVIIDADKADQWAEALKFGASQVRTGLVIPQGSPFTAGPQLNGIG